MKGFEIGEKVELERPYRGYRYGEIIGYEFPCYIVQFDSGMEEKFFSSEFKEA
jgi:hypothetical protein